MKGKVSYTNPINMPLEKIRKSAADWDREPRRFSEFFLVALIELPEFEAPANFSL